MSAKPGEVTPGDAGTSSSWCTTPIVDPISLELDRRALIPAMIARGFAPFAQEPARNIVNQLHFLAGAWATYFDQTAQRSTTAVVAAVGALADSRRMADYNCDGTADQVEIQAALDAVNVAGGGEVYLSEGTFTLSAGISIPSNVCLRGSGWRTILSSADGGGAQVLVTFAASGSDQKLRDLMIDGSLVTGANSRIGIRMDNPTRARVLHVRINGIRAGASDGQGVHLTNGSDVVIAFCTITACGRSAILTDETAVADRGIKIVHVTGSGPVVPASSLLSIGSSGCTIDSPSLDGAGLAGLIGILVTAGSDIEINVPEITDVGSDGIRVASGVVRCEVDGGAIGRSTAAAGIHFAAGATGSSVVGTRIYNCVNGVLIAANECSLDAVKIDSSTGDGVSITGLRAKVIGCWIRNSGGDGIHVTGHQALLVTNFIFDSDQHGIFLQNADNCGVHTNHIFDVSQGADNTFDAIRVDNSDRAHVSGNTHRRVAGLLFTRWGISVTGGAVDVFLHGNLLAAGSTNGNNGVPGAAAVAGSSIQADGGTSVVGLQGLTVLGSNQQMTL